MTRTVRWLYKIHRYLGIALCVPMLAWCLSGMVMVYVPYPSLPESVRQSHLAPIDWSNCCAVAEETSVRHLQIEMLDGHPLARIGRSKIEGVSEETARKVASSFGGTAESVEKIDYDQWTVSGSFNHDRPLYRVTLAGPEGRQVYVSSSTGKAVQITDRQERFWNWLGAVPHWIYFTELRRNVALWAQIVIWTSLIGGFLTLTGIIIGVRQSLRAPVGKWSTQRGVKLWHHLPGLIFGLFALTWVISGTLSMNPWGALEGGDSAEESAKLRGITLTGAMIKQALPNLQPANAVSVVAAPFDGTLSFIATAADGSRTRLDATGHPAVEISLDRAAALLDSVTAGRIEQEDAYYFSHHREAAPLPAYRLILGDGRRFYLDPLSGDVLASLDGADKGYRWLYQAPHRLDFAPILRERPVRDLVMLTLLIGMSVSFATGLWLTIRWIRKRL